MNGARFLTVPASTCLTGAVGERARSGVGFAVVDGQLCVSISDQESGRVMVASLHETVLDDFCGALADHLAEVSPEASALMQESEPWPSLQ